MKSYLKFLKNSRFHTALAAAVLTVLFTGASVFGATTISTNISTDGTLSVTGASTLTGNVTAAGTLAVTGATTITGLTTMGYASSTGISLTPGAGTNALSVGGNATVTTNGNVETRGGLTVGNATTNSLAGTILFSAQTSDPTGVTEGTVYYNSSSKVLKLFDGTDWFTTGTTSSGFLLNNNQIRLDNLATRHLALGTTTQQSSGNALVTLEATTTASVPLSLVAYTSQTGDVFDVLDSGSAKLFYLNATGQVFASSTAQVTGTFTTYGNTVLGDAQGDTLTVTGTATIPFASTTAVTATTASTTNLIVGGNSTSGTVAGMVHGTCDIVSSSITASTTQGLQCTSATGVSTAFTRVFVMATSSLATHLTAPVNGFTVQAASSTANDIIGVTISNFTGANNTVAGTLVFWAVR